jgi:hypothetical protein
VHIKRYTQHLLTGIIDAVKGMYCNKFEILKQCSKLERENNAEMIGSDDLYKAQLLNSKRHIYQPLEVVLDASFKSCLWVQRFESSLGCWVIFFWASQIPWNTGSQMLNLM